MNQTLAKLWEMKVKYFIVKMTYQFPSYYVKKLAHSVVVFLRVRTTKPPSMDPISEVCLLVNSYQVTLPTPGDIFVDQKTLDEFLSVQENGRKTKRQKSARVSSEGFHLENIRVLGTPLTEIKRKIGQMIRKLNGKWSCSQCGKETNTKQNTERHIESHIKDMEFGCNLCQKRLKSTQGARYHALKCKINE